MAVGDHPLRGAEFVLAAHRLDQLPADVGAEIAFAGRSNAGKSSAINALTGHAGLARTSKTPGRTQQLVVFVLPDGRRLIDLPGYGHAEVPPSLRAHWRHTLDAYLHQRQSLRGLLLIADIRHAPAPFDRQMLAYCAEVGLRCVVLLSKADKLSRSQVNLRRHEVEAELAKQAWHASTIPLSVPAKTGIVEARAAALALLAAD